MQSSIASGGAASSLQDSKSAAGVEALVLWHNAVLLVAGATTFQELKEALLQGAMQLSGAKAGLVRLLGEVSFPGCEVSIPPQVKEEASWRRLPLRWQGQELGMLSLPAVPPKLHEVDWLELLVEHASVAVAKTGQFEQLQSIKREWQAMLDGMMDGVYVCDASGTILRANRALAAVLGTPIPELLGKTRNKLWEDLPDYRVLKPWQIVDGGGGLPGPSVLEFSFGWPERVFLEMAFDLRVDAGSEDRRLCVLHDVTESRRMQEQLLQTEKLAALGELTSGVAHELNNPLATVVGYAELLELETELPVSVRRKVNTIHQEATRASHIVSNLLAYARRSAPEKAFVSVNDVVEAAVEMRRYQLNSQDVHIITEMESPLPHVFADPLQIQQVVLNIINNAVQALQAWRGSGEIRLLTRTALLNGAPVVRITIEDNGPGIAPEHLRRVFDPFFTTKPTGEGTGLGMSIALRIISNHEGLIWAESNFGHGARFVIELPATGSGEAEPPQARYGEALPAPATQVSGKRILVIDDEEPIVTLISEILMLDGHEVTPAFNGAEALALLRAQDYDLILSDVRMPAVGGPTFFEILQTTRPDLLPRVIFVTGDTMSASTRQFLRRTGRPVLAKPFDPERLRRLVFENLERTAPSPK